MKDKALQIGKPLKIVATPPEVVPAVFCFRTDFSAAFKEHLLTGVRDLHMTPAGQQALTIFQSEKTEDQSALCLDNALEMLTAHDRLCAPTSESLRQRNLARLPAAEPGAHHDG